MPVPPKTIPYRPERPSADSTELSSRLNKSYQRRRSVRQFSTEPVPRAVIKNIVSIAGSAPSGANKQPWRFVCISDPQLKAKIREGAEHEERLFYQQRASERWLKDLEAIGTDANKDFLATAPWLIVVFKLNHTDDGGQVYYASESVGLAAGFLLSAIHQLGLVALTHTPSPMKFLREILDRPKHERPFLLIPVGYPAADCMVPDIQRKELEEILVWRE